MFYIFLLYLCFYWYLWWSLLFSCKICWLNMYCMRDPWCLCKNCLWIVLLWPMLQFVFAQQSSGGLGDLKDPATCCIPVSVNSNVSITPLTQLPCSRKYKKKDGIWGSHDQSIKGTFVHFPLAAQMFSGVQIELYLLTLLTVSVQ